MTKTLQFVFLLLVATLLWGCSDKTQISSGPSPAASLSGLTISGATLSPAFSPDTLTYTTSVDHTTDSITVTPTATDSNATINVNGVVVPTGSTSPPIPLKVGDNAISIVVTEPDGTTKETYTVTVTRLPSIDAALSALTLSSGSLVPAFDTNVLVYSASVAHATDSISVTPTAHDPDATITVNGVAVTSGSASQAIPLVVGDNTINILVTAQDLTKHTDYVVTVTRAPSADALLSALALSEGSLTPAFDPSVLNYTATVPHATDSVTVTATTDDPNATLAVDGLPVTSGTASQALPLNVGDNVIQVDVTAQDGSTTSPYVITLTREPSDDAALASLTLSSGSLKPDFKTSELNYTANVVHATDSITVTPTADDPAATITLTVKDPGGTITDIGSVTSGTASQSIPLAVGDTIITILVTARDGLTATTYTITVTRAPSSVATLSKLTLSEGLLTPAFQPTFLTYGTFVTTATASITVTPTATDSTAIITVNGTAVSSGTASQSIPLTIGAPNTITIVVTAQDGSTTTTYTLTVTRVSVDATLSSLELSTGIAVTLKPNFDSNTFNYTASALSTDTEVRVTATANSPYYTSIKVNGVEVVSGLESQPIALSNGVTTINVVVTAQDAGFAQTYTIDVKRPWPGTPIPFIIKADNPDNNDGFALALAVEGMTMIVGAPGEASGSTTDQTNNAAQDAGAAYAFMFDPTVGSTGSWSQTWYIKANNPKVQDFFGQDVSISSNTIAIGAPGYDNAASDNVGAVFIFTRADSTASVWSQAAVLTPTANVQFTLMGTSVVIDGDTVAAGSRNENITGTVHVFERDANGLWTNLPDLRPSDDTTRVFGEDVAIDGDTMVIGAPTPAAGGAAYVFTRDANGNWTESQILAASNPDTGDRFGNAVAIDGDILVVGAWREDSGDSGNENDNSVEDSGAAYVFRRDGSGTWSQEAYLKAPNPQEKQLFGRSIAIDNGNIAVGTPAGENLIINGTAYVFSRTINGWEQLGILDPPSPVTDNNFGVSIDISGDQVLVGESVEDTNAPDSGAAHAYK